MNWFRFYSEVLHDPKVQRLPAELFRFWVNLLCLANEGKPRGLLPPVDDLAFALRIKSDRAGRMLGELVAAGLLDVSQDGAMTPHNWSSRQHKSDDVSERVKRWRERARDTLHDDTPNGDTDVTCNVTRNVTETPRGRADSETDTDSETETPLSPPGGVGGGDTPESVSKLAEELYPGTGWGAMARRACEVQKFPPRHVAEALSMGGNGKARSWRFFETILERFRSQGGTDSEARARQSPPARASPQPSPAETKAAALALKARILAKEAARG